MIEDDSKSNGAEASGGHRSARYLNTVLVVGLIATAAATCTLYIPYLDNKLVFDDGALFANLSVFDSAQTPFSQHPRAFPYFTIGFFEVEFHSIRVHRIVSLILHLLNTFMMFRVVKVLLEHTEGISREKALWLALFGANFFALHPVAVYGAAYLVQRTIVFALLFSLLSIWFYLRALRVDRWTDCLSAALFYTLAVFSKEHAIMLPAAVVVLSPIIKPTLEEYKNKAFIFLGACAPAAIWVFVDRHNIVGVTYEEVVSNTIAQMGSGMPLDTALGRWFVSAVTQMGLFFEYLQLWLLPDVSQMSIDMRIDFAALWIWPLIALRIAAFAAVPVLALWLIAQRKRWALLGTGLLYAWLMFLPELSAVRFQEPFVLYRSYLWAPAFVVAVLVGLALLPNYGVIASGIVGSLLCFSFAVNRLGSFGSELSVWDDAAGKLSREDIPGADRIYYNRAHELYSSGNYAEARKDIQHVISMTPWRFEAHSLLAESCLALADFACARSSLATVLKLNPNFGPAYFGLGQVLEHDGNIGAARSEYSKSLKLGYSIAQLKIEALGEVKKNSGAP